MKYATAEQVIQARANVGESTLQAAERVEISQRMWQLYEAGKHRMPLERFEKYMRKTRIYQRKKK